MTVARLPIHDRMVELADTTRCRLLGALEGQELTVTELCSALQLPQSTVSRHLRILSDEGWVVSRAEGASRWYRMTPTLERDARALWELVRAPLRESATARQDEARVRAVLAERRTRSEAFFDSASAEWDSMRQSLFGGRADLLATLALLDPTWTVGDLGCGTGTLSAALAPHVATVKAVDASRAMLAAARARLADHGNVQLHEGALESMPLETASLDAAILLLVLHHVADPLAVLVEARRALRVGGRLLIADMQSHTHEEYRATMGHVWLGFDTETISSWLIEAGFASIRHAALPVDPNATGPALFTTTAVAR